MSKGINIDFLDRDVSPGDDFYEFVNGGWLRRTEIPPDRSSWGSFHQLAKETDEKVLHILDDQLIEKGAAKNIAARLFESGMEINNIETAKLNAINEVVDHINSIAAHNDFEAMVASLIPKGFGPLLQLSVHPDLGNSKIYSAYLEPGALGLPEKEYYLEQDEKSQDIQTKYKNYVALLLVEGAGYAEAKAREAAENIFLLEKELAGYMMAKEERRQIDKLYNPHSKTQLSEQYAEWNWPDFFGNMQVPIPERIIITDTEYLRNLVSEYKKYDIDTLKNYLLFLVIHHSAPYAHSTLETAHFNFYSGTLEGVEVMRPRQQRIVKVVNQILGEALGRLFVDQYFPPKAKEIALEMVDDILDAFRNRIQQLSWMSAATKQYALEKLAAFTVKIGYPEKWKTYDGLMITGSGERGSYLQNLLSAVEWKFKDDVSRIGQDVDKDEWFMAPQVVNAYYNPVFNEIVFPAAILQPPFFDWEADAAVNYGGIGAVIGHEITHGFDDQGSRFDKEGNFNEWWSADDRERFQELTQKLVTQFDAYSPFEDLNLNGTFTLGENIADLGGLSVAYDALQLYYTRHPRPLPIDGFTAEQRFFMSWATVWRTKIRNEALRNQIKTDPHPPGLYRAVAPPSNLDSFYQAFEVVPDSKWYRKKEERIRIW